MVCNFLLRHRGDVHTPLRWKRRVTAAERNCHRGGTHYSLCTTKIINSAELHNREPLKYHVFNEVEVLTSGF